MRSVLLLITLILLSAQGHSQPFLVGTTSLILHDDDRDRDVACTVYYPAITAEADATVANGIFPTLVFGHGFVMTVSAYNYLGEHFASVGNIVALPTTEGGFAPDHALFGQDLAFVSTTLQSLGGDTDSPFNGHVSTAAALMGHSMGGGAALLAAAGNSDIQAVVVLAPAETTPSAIAAVAQIGVPTLIFAASEDCITPIATNAQPINDASNASCKAFVNILGGGHCYFGDASLTCSLGEFTCNPNLTIDRGEQQQAVLDVADLWLERFLGGLTEAYSILSDTLANSTRFTSQVQCFSTGIGNDKRNDLFTAGWMATTQALAIAGLMPGDLLDVFDATGRSVKKVWATSDHLMMKIPGDVEGIVMVRLQRGDGYRTIRVPVFR